MKNKYKKNKDLQTNRGLVSVRTYISSMKRADASARDTQNHDFCKQKSQFSEKDQKEGLFLKNRIKIVLRIDSNSFKRISSSNTTLIKRRVKYAQARTRKTRAHLRDQARKNQNNK